MTRLLPIVILLLACEELPPDELVPLSVAQIKVGGSHVTGFFVEEHTVATVEHCIHNEETRASVKYQDENGRIRRTIGEIIYKSKSKDLSLIRVRVSGQPAPICKAHIGDPVRVYGWRTMYNTPRSREGYIFTRWTNNYTTTARTEAGYSGGPVAYQDCVIAMHQGKTSIGTTHDTYNNWGGMGR